MSSHVEKKNSPKMEEDFGKKAYVGPVLNHQAHLRDITLAPSPGTFESGFGSGFFGGGSPPLNSPEGDNKGSGEIFENDIFGE